MHTHTLTLHEAGQACLRCGRTTVAARQGRLQQWRRPCQPLGIHRRRLARGHCLYWDGDWHCQYCATLPHRLTRTPCRAAHPTAHRRYRVKGAEVRANRRQGTAMAESDTSSIGRIRQDGPAARQGPQPIARRRLRSKTPDPYRGTVHAGFPKRRRLRSKSPARLRFQSDPPRRPSPSPPTTRLAPDRDQQVCSQIEMPQSTAPASSRTIPTEEPDCVQTRRPSIGDGCRGSAPPSPAPHRSRKLRIVLSDDEAPRRRRPRVESSPSDCPPLRPRLLDSDDDRARRGLRRRNMLPTPVQGTANKEAARQHCLRRSPSSTEQSGLSPTPRGFCRSRSPCRGAATDLHPPSALFRRRGDAVADSPRDVFDSEEDRAKRHLRKRRTGPPEAQNEGVSKSHRICPRPANPVLGGDTGIPLQCPVELRRDCEPLPSSPVPRTHSRPSDRRRRHGRPPEAV